MAVKDIKEYEIIKQYYMEDLNSQAYLLKHKKTGARIALLSNDDNNKVFNIGFRTPVNDDTGVPHIIEHTVLCGSDKFPVKDPFIELVKGSLNTFLNAMTYPDKTVYPLASCNEKDFQNIMDVYLDAVFNPQIYNHQEIFKQEGWHYELESPEDELKINGVVYNEMKGAFSSVAGVLDRQVLHSLFPDTTYGFESGGDPVSIPDLTYEEYLDFHRKYYHPSNSFIYLYGDMDMEEKLRFIDKEYLSKYDTLEIDSEIKMQKPFDKPAEVESYYPISDGESEEDNTILSWNVVLDTTLNKEDILAFQVLDYVLMTMPGAVLKQKIIDAGIGKNVESTYESGILQPYWSIVAKYANYEDKDKFKSIIKSGLEEIVQNGIEKESLIATINNLEFKYRESDFGRWPRGLMIGLQMYESWIYDENQPFIYVECNETYAFLKKMVETDYFEKLIEKYVLNSKIESTVVLKPKKGLVAETEKELADKLTAKKATLSKSEIDKLVADTKALKKYQEEPSPEEDLKKIPMLEISDIDPEPRTIKSQIREINGIPTVYYDCFTNGIGYAILSFDCKNIPTELLPYIGLLKNTAGYMNTESYNYTQLANEINKNIGGIYVDATLYPDAIEKNKFEHRVEVNFKSMISRMDKAFEIAKEVMLTTKFDDYKRLKEIIDEIKARLQNTLMESGDSAAALRAGSYFSETMYRRENYAGITFYKFIEDIANNFENVKEEVAAKLKLLTEYVFRKENLVISYVCKDDEYDSLPGLVEDMTDSLYDKEPDSSILSSDKVEKFAKNVLNEGFKTSSQVQYVVRAGQFDTDKYPYTGTLSVLKTILVYEYLWNNVRVKGGAYGCSNFFTKQGVAMFTSYRDPKLKETNEIYENVVDYINNFNAGDRDMRKFIIGTISEYDQPRTPCSEGGRLLTLYFNHNTFENLKKERSQVLSTTTNAIRNCGSLVADALKEYYVCVIGNEGRIEENKDMFKNIYNLFENKN